MQQHLMQMQPMMAAYYPTNVTTDHIQQVFFSFQFLKICYYSVDAFLVCTVDCCAEMSNQIKM